MVYPTMKTIILLKKEDLYMLREISRTQNTHINITIFHERMVNNIKHALIGLHLHVASCRWHEHGVEGNGTGARFYSVFLFIYGGEILGRK